MRRRGTWIARLSALDRSLGSKARGGQFAVAIGFILACTGSVSGTPLIVDLATASDVVRLRGEDIDDATGVESVGCDVNGDGLTDLIVSAPNADGPNNSRAYSGEVSVIFGRRGAWSGDHELATSKDVWIVGHQAFDSAGSGLGCGDLNQDGMSEIFIGAPDADSIGGARLDGGQVHILWGRSSWPAVIDLLTDPGSVVYGAKAGDGVGDHAIVAGDVTGDGRPELVVAAYRAKNQTGSKSIVGKLHVLFWRANWPSTLDLLTQSDVTIYGRSASDGLGITLALGDMEADGTLDIIAGASGGDGPLDGRDGAGQAYVFRGRTSWPSLINLAATSADCVIYGVDAGDDTFPGNGLAVGDLDADHRLELLTGARLADGPANDQPSMGEARNWQTIASLPPTVDLRTQTRRVAYGVATGDYTARGVRAGDVSGDGTDDWMVDATLADGPGGSRIDAGAVFVFWGGITLGTDLRASDGQQNVTIHGPSTPDGSILVSPTDLNADGIKEVVLVTSISSATTLPSVYLVSPLDTDGDGISQLVDVCPLVYDPAQTDSNGDRLGDACAGDYDGDLVPDGQDCAPSRRTAGRPREVANLLVARGTPSRIEWSALPTADRYDVLRGSVALLATGDYGSCQTSRDADPTDTVFNEPDLPAPGSSFAFLVRGRDTECGGAGTYGTRSNGTERLNTNPTTCP